VSRTKIIASPNEPPLAGAAGLAGAPATAPRGDEEQSGKQQDLHDLLHRLRFDGAGEIEQRERRHAESTA